MNIRLVPTATTAAAALVLALAGCATQPIAPPTVVDAQLSARKISPGDSVGYSFTLDVIDPAAVKRVYLRGLLRHLLQG